MRIIGLLFFLFLFSGASCEAQYTNMNWVFGDSCGIKFNSLGIDSFFVSKVKSRGTCVSISDSVNNLLFYAASPNVPLWLAGYTRDGVSYSNQHQKISNGDSLMTTGWYKEMLIIPDVGHVNKFYLFTSGETNAINPGLRYSYVDLAGSLPYVTQKNILICSGQITDGVTGIKHGNGRDYWVLFKKWGTPNSKFYKILITPNGLSPVDSQAIGSVLSNGFFRIITNATGNLLATLMPDGLIELYNFDRCTGILSNYQTIAYPLSQLSTATYFWDGAFSPSGRFLYVSTGDTTSMLYQLDLQNTDPFGSKYTLDSTNTPKSQAAAVRLAPDGRIYTSRAWYDGVNFNFPYSDTTYNIYNTHLSVINYPDSLGFACAYLPNSVYLPKCRNYLGLPNNPDYTLGPLVGSICDTLSVGLQDNPQSEIPFLLFPNPFANSITLERRTGWNQSCDITIVDLNGRKLMQYLWSTGKRFEISTDNWLSGVYLIQINMNGRFFNMKAVKI